MENFWKNLPSPFTVLAPLDGITDVVFRQMMVKLGKPDVLFTEFTSTDGIISPGGSHVAENFYFKPNEQPVVAQIWGIKPENFYTTAQLVKELGFAGIDINMGCPVRAIIKDGACSALIKNHSLTKEIIQATKEGAGDLPLSIKTRIGFNEEQIENWIGFLLEQDLSALTIHLRTVEEQSRVPAHWELMPQIKKLRDDKAPHTILVGNGDIRSLNEVEEKYRTYDIDGFMIGRGIFSNPWIFNKAVNHEQITINQRFSSYLEHIKLFQETWKGKKNPANIRKFCKAYINNFEGAAAVREKMMQTNTLKDLMEVIKLGTTTVFVN